MKPARRLWQSRCSAIRNQNGCSILFEYVLLSATKSLTHLGRNMVTAVNKGKGRGPQKESVRFRITFIREERRESMKILIRGPKRMHAAKWMEKYRRNREV